MKRSTLRQRLLISILAPLLAACGGAALEGRPTVRPVVVVTRVPTQDVPGTQTAYAVRIVPTPTPAGLYIVKAGDTLGKIADSFETTVDEIIAQNNISDPNQIEVGQALIIPSLLTPTAASVESPSVTP
jgi:LysM repeat protein